MIDSIELTLKRIVESDTPDFVKGKLIDTFTAKLLLTVITKLNEENKKQLFSRSINEMVAVSYKLLIH